MDITIRDAVLEDAPRILEIYAYYVRETAITFEYEVPSLSDFQARIARTKSRYPYLVIEKDKVVQKMKYIGGKVYILAPREPSETEAGDGESREHDTGQ